MTPPIAFGNFDYRVTPYCEGRVCITTSSVQPAFVQICDRRDLEFFILINYGAIKQIYEQALDCLKGMTS